ncbi:glycosyltransferase [Lichenibacterium dinghuense]|uniref:glycosyltransferase n=1 Tax=Lichenibacterium dinghuense TaxID=2895977 RepID=UPI001F486580|nr:glycosyltransferase [Lichenibacterium sp. 6Y81]
MSAPRAGRRLRICFVAGELLGAHKNGGIGTATTHAALLLARAGHDVSVVYTGSPWIDYAHPWVRRLQAAGVALTHLDARAGEIYPVWMRETCVIHDYLRGLEHDLILFQDWEGPAFASVVAKRAASAFAGTTLAVVAHGPTAWLLDANRALARDQRTLAHLEMERVAFEAADAVLCPSRHMLDWLRASDIRVADDAEAVPLYLWSDEEPLPSRRGRALDRVDRIAFFGRLETRKGVDLFLDAVLSDALATRDFEVIFVGKPASHTPDTVRAAVALRRPSLLPRLSFQPDLDTDAAQAFLCDEGCLAVIPSLIDNAPCVISECLRRGIPFLSTSTGGIPELVAEDDRGRVLVEPEASALAARLADALERPFAPARPAHAERETGARWTAWCSRVAGKARAAAAPFRSGAARERSPDGRIAVVVTHHERPALVEQTLESLAAQTRTDFDLVLVDDGSRSAAALAALAALERRRWPFALTVLRGPNRYLGAARNAGLRASAADRFVFMDDDNIAFPNLVERLDEAMSRSGADIVTCQMSIFRDPSGEPDPAELASAERWGFLGGSGASGVELGLSVNCFGDATGIYRREVFDRVGFFHERRGVGHEDWQLHARAVLAGLTVLSLPEPLYWYRRVATGMLLSTDAYANNRVVWDAYAEALPSALRRFVDLSVRNHFTGDPGVLGG